MPLGTPTISLRSNPTGRNIGIDITNVGAVGTVDHYNVWRSAAEENSGQPVMLTNIWTQDGPETFRDYWIASGRTYTYFVQAILGSAVTTSATASISLTLLSGGLVAVTKYRDGGNATAMTSGLGQLTLTDLIPHGRQYGLATAQYVIAGASTPSIQISNIEEVSINLTAMIASGDDADRTILREMYTIRDYVMFNDTRGNKVFGRLSFEESYVGLNTLVPLTFQVCDFNESAI